MCAPPSTTHTRTHQHTQLNAGPMLSHAVDNVVFVELFARSKEKNQLFLEYSGHVLPPNIYLYEMIQKRVFVLIFFSSLFSLFLFVLCFVGGLFFAIMRACMCLNTVSLKYFYIYFHFSTIRPLTCLIALHLVLALAPSWCGICGFWFAVLVCLLVCLGLCLIATR